jgi:hypothetical protein
MLVVLMVVVVVCVGIAKKLANRLGGSWKTNCE